MPDRDRSTPPLPLPLGLPLQGLRVLDLSTMWAMPGVSVYLADQGADVVKVEPPGGDLGRTIASMPPIEGQSRAFWMMNRNKRGIVLDLKQPAAGEVARRLAREADVLVHNFRPGVERRIGIDYDTLAALNPRLVYVSFTSYGERGPLAGLRGYDLLVQAASGIAGRRRGADGSPQPLGVFAVDMASSIMLGYAVALALLERERTGRGQRVSGSLLQTALALQMCDLVRVRGRAEPPFDSSTAEQAVFSRYRCADGEYVQIAVVSDAEWASLCRALESESLARDPDFADMERRRQGSESLRGRLRELFALRPAAHWQERFEACDVPGMHIQSPDAVFDSEQLAANDMLVEIEQPGIGPAVMTNVPFRLLDAATAEMRPAPGLGEHTDEVLAELGYDASTIARLREEGAIG